MEEPFSFEFAPKSLRMFIQVLNSMVDNLEPREYYSNHLNMAGLGVGEAVAVVLLLLADHDNSRGWKRRFSLRNG